MAAALLGVAALMFLVDQFFRRFGKSPGLRMFGLLALLGLSRSDVDSGRLLDKQSVQKLPPRPLNLISQTKKPMSTEGHDRCRDAKSPVLSSPGICPKTRIKKRYFETLSKNARRL